MLSMILGYISAFAILGLFLGSIVALCVWGIVTPIIDDKRRKEQTEWEEENLSENDRIELNFRRIERMREMRDTRLY